jgi:tetratricopeptide (TPR) repeat protein
MKKVGVFLLFFLVIAPSLSLGDDYHEEQLGRGIRNSDTYAYLLIHRASLDQEKAVNLLQEAASYDPDLPAVYFALSRATFSFSVQGVLDSIDYIVRGLDSYTRNFWWSFTLGGSLLFSLVLSFVLAVALILLVRLFPDLPLLSHDIGETTWKVSFLLAMVALSAAGPLLFLGGLAVLIGLYMKKYSRAVVYMFLVFLLCFPFFSRAALHYLNAVADGNLRAIVEVNESENNTYALTTLENANDFDSVFSYALALKRVGRYDDAIAVYKNLLEKRQDPRVYVNLGNCYFDRYNFDEANKADLQEAEDNYSAALKIRPLVSAEYNLSQVSREMLDFPKGEQYFKSALELDRSAVAGYRAISARKPNRFVVDETLNVGELWDYALAAEGKFSSLGISMVPPGAASLAALLLAIFFYIMNSGSGARAYRCKKCNKILCEKCESRVVWGRMCPECYASLIKLEDMDVRERVSRLLSIYDQQRRYRFVLKVLSFAFPGLAEAYAGKNLIGLLFLWPFLFFLLLPGMVVLVVPDYHLVSHSFIRWASLLLAAVLYVVFCIITRKRIAKGWL